jgi:adenylate cyclase
VKLIDYRRHLGEYIYFSSTTFKVIKFSFSLFRRLTRTPVLQFYSNELLGVLMAWVAVTGLLLGVKQLGWLQPLELVIYDFMVRLRPDPGPDPRLLVVGINESDIRELKRWPPSDEVLAQVLAELQAAKAKVIGIDLVRNIPYEPGNAELIKQLKQPNVITITYLGNNEAESIPAPPEIPKEQIGFSDVLLDPDNAIRRNLMFVSRNQNVFRSLSLRLALVYLKAAGISAKLSKNQDYQLGETVFYKLEENAGGYQNIDAKGYQILLNYRSRHPAKEISLNDVIHKNFNPNLVKDKIVLIGPNAHSLKDVFFTPYSAGERGEFQMAGVLIHAQMVSQILGAVIDKKPLLWYGNEWGEVLWIVGWAILGAVGAARIQNPLILGGFSIVSLAGLFGIGFGLFIQGGWIPLAAPALGLILTCSTVVTWQKQQSKQQQQTAMKLLGQQTSPAIAKALWQKRENLLKSGILPGETIPVTVLFSDIKNFSSISERMNSESLMKWLNEYLNIMSHEIIAHQGIVNKFMGDGIMAVFGVPIKRTSELEIAADAKSAVNCALAMRERLQELNEGWKKQGLPIIQIRVGISTGMATVGSLGGTERLEYGVIGDRVNIASRLESCEKERQIDNCRILIAEETLIYLPEEFEVEYWGAMQLKGKEQPVKVYRVTGKLIVNPLKES